MASTINLQATANWVLPQVGYKPINIGPGNEPLITNANVILQTILGPPFCWRWNRNEFTFPISKISIPPTAPPTGGTDTVVSVPTFGFIERASLIKTGAVPFPTTPALYTPHPEPAFVSPIGGTGPAPAPATIAAPYLYFPLKVHNELMHDSGQGRPESIAAQFDDGQGNITFRTVSGPDGNYTVVICHQQKPVPFQTMTGFWAPIPDEYSYIYQYGVLALCLMYQGDTRFQVVNRDFISRLLGAAEGLSEMQRNLFLGNWEAVTRQMESGGLKTRQGVAARGT
jgi:hypothetical protein